MYEHVAEIVQQNIEAADKQRQQMVKNLIRSVVRKLGEYTDANLDYDEEKKLLEEVRTMSRHLRDLEEALEEQESVTYTREKDEEEGDEGYESGP